MSGRERTENRAVKTLAVLSEISEAMLGLRAVGCLLEEYKAISSAVHGNKSMQRKHSTLWRIQGSFIHSTRFYSYFALSSYRPTTTILVKKIATTQSTVLVVSRLWVLSRSGSILTLGLSLSHVSWVTITGTVTRDCQRIETLSNWPERRPQGGFRLSLPPPSPPLQSSLTQWSLLVLCCSPSPSRGVV